MLRAAGGSQENNLEERRDRGECSVLGSRVEHTARGTLLGAVKQAGTQDKWLLQDLVGQMAVNSG